jgi:hypothetical protein
MNVVRKRCSDVSVTLSVVTGVCTVTSHMPLKWARLGYRIRNRVDFMSTKVTPHEWLRLFLSRWDVS